MSDPRPTNWTTPDVFSTQPAIDLGQRGECRSSPPVEGELVPPRADVGTALLDAISRYTGTVPDSSGAVIVSGGMARSSDAIHVGFTDRWCEHLAVLRDLAPRDIEVQVFEVALNSSEANRIAVAILAQSENLREQGVPIATTAANPFTGYVQVVTPQPESADRVIREVLALAADVPIEIRRGDVPVLTGK